MLDFEPSWSRTPRLIGPAWPISIMTAHVFNAALDSEYPATLSKTTIDGILRGQLGYDGVVISDDMQMGAIRKHYGFEEAVLKAIEAGVDILAIANNSVFEEDVGGAYRGDHPASCGNRPAQQRSASTVPTGAYSH